MPKTPQLQTPTIADQISELERELAMRKVVYPKLIARGKLLRSEANMRYLRLDAALRKLREVNGTQQATQATLPFPYQQANH